MKQNILLPILLITLCGLIMTGCNKEPKTAKIAQTAIKSFQQTAFLQGVVSNNSGVIKAGKVEAANENGQVISQTTMENGHYRLEIPANTALPILLTFSPESGTEKLVAAVINDSVTEYYINPTTTAIAKAAKATGGYSHANMVRAAENTTHVPDANKTSTGWRGDPTTQYGGWH
jgi:hypothetical protein